MTMNTYYEYASYGTKEYRIDVAHKWSKKKVCITWFLYNFNQIIVPTLQIAYYHISHTKNKEIPIHKPTN
jgi:hypothetical protein